MTDIYRELAADVADHSAADVSADERERAKQAFWRAFERVSQLEGNEHLRAGRGDIGPEKLGDRTRFREHASPEAIEDALARAYAERVLVDNQVQWLEQLLIRRARQIQAGEWPAAVSS